MGSSNSYTRWYVITSLWFLISNLSFFPSFSQHLNIHNNVINNLTNPTSLDDYLYKYSSNTISKKPPTGVLFNISLPSNFSGMNVSIVRLRSSTMWAKGAKFSYFDIPPKVITNPYVRRVAIMYENFGNLSSHYYELPGYKFISTIIGFAVYNATEFSSKSDPQRLNITISGEPINIKFTNQVSIIPQGKFLKHVKCVRFDPNNGLVVLSDLVSPNVCVTHGLGHFALAVPGVDAPQASHSPSPISSKVENRTKIALWKLWLIGFAAGLVALLLLVSCIVCGYKMVNSRKFARMERKAEKSEFLDTRWIGTSKMPSAPVTRTQGAIENDFAP